MIGIPKEALRKAYRQRIKSALTTISASFALAENLVESDNAAAVGKYEECLRALHDISRDMQLYLVLNSWKDDLVEGKGIASQQSIEKKLHALQKSRTLAPAEIARILLKPLLDNSPSSKSSTFAIGPLEYGTTGFVSEFGNTL